MTYANDSNGRAAERIVLAEAPDLGAEGYTVRSLGGGDYAVNIRRRRSGAVFVSAQPIPPTPTS